MGLLTISKFAKLSGVKQTSLRYYDELGILKPMSVTQGGYRLYAPEQIPMAQAINLVAERGAKVTRISSIGNIIDEQRQKIAAEMQKLQDDYEQLTNYRKEILPD